MPSLQSIKESPWINPLTICIAVCAFLFLNILVQFGEPIGSAMQHVFLPYFLDISRGVGRAGAAAFRGIALIMQLGVIGLVVARGVSKEKAAKAASSALGIGLVLVYFLLIGVGYLLPRLH